MLKNSHALVFLSRRTYCIVSGHPMFLVAAVLFQVPGRKIDCRSQISGIFNSELQQEDRRKLH